MLEKQDFRTLAREENGYRPAAERVRDWREIQATPCEKGISLQARRCMDCGVPFCQSNTGCPLQNEIPRWNELVAGKRWQEALDRLHATNNFPEFTGSLCPAPCESACVLGLHSDPVTIKNIEWSVIEKGFEQDLVRARRPLKRSGKRVAVVGSGPAGLAAAQELCRAGHSVEVFERQARPGGLLRYGIPDFKLEKWRIDRRLRQLEEEGVVFHTNTALGRDITLAGLEEAFDAVALAIGAESPRDLPLPGRELSGIHFAMDYLRERNRILSGELDAEAIPAISCKGKDVVILGGGDTGSDCLGSALREGARSVRQWEIQARPPASRDPSTPWPLWPMKLRSSHAHEEGGEREWSIVTREFLGRNGRLTGLRAERLVAADAGRPAEFVIQADLVILALGFTGASTEAWNAGARLPLSERGTIVTDAHFQTSIPSVFAAGDARRGASLVVWAIAEGRKMAQAIDRYLCGAPLALHCE